MNSLREERAHRLADEVGRRDARDPEPVGDLGRDGRLARAGRAADEQDDRQVERRAGRGSGAAGARRRSPSSSPSVSRASSLEPLERRSTSRRARRGRPRPAARARTRGRPETPARDQRPRHQALRVRQAVLAAERQRLAGAGARVIAATASRAIASRRASSSRRGRAAERDDARCRRTRPRTPALERGLGDDVDRGRLDLDEVDVGVDARRGPRAARSRSARLPETCTTSAPSSRRCRRRSCAPAAPS